MTTATYSDLLRPKTRSYTLAYDILMVIAGSLLVALTAQISIPVPFSPVPITGQTFGVLITGVLLGSRKGSLALLTYLLEGSIGLPFFAGGAFGIARLLGPTGGYLFGFVIAALVVGFMAERGWDRRVWKSLTMLTIGTAIIFICGVAWLSGMVGLEKALITGFYPFIVGAMIKISAAASVLPLGWRALGHKH